jgi:hypothetical protein
MARDILACLLNSRPNLTYVPIHVPKSSKSPEFSMIEHGGKSRQVIEKIGGASRDRTDDLIVANDALSQLSYSPEWRKFFSLILAAVARFRLSAVSTALCRRA